MSSLSYLRGEKSNIKIYDDDHKPYSRTTNKSNHKDRRVMDINKLLVNVNKAKQRENAQKRLQEHLNNVSQHL